MKTVIINGQNHKGCSYYIGRVFAKKVADKSEITEFFLPRDLNHFCLGCCQCLISDDKCPFFSEKKTIMDAIEQAELLIFTTPTYCMRASAPMKSFIDLTFTNWMPHKPKPTMFYKKAVVFSSAAGAGTKSAMKDITTCLKYWGVSYVKSLGFTVSAMNKEGMSDKILQQIDQKTQRLARTVVNKKVHVGIRTRLLFNLMRLNIKNLQNAEGPLRSDYMYWKNNGWLDGKKPYKKDGSSL